MHADELRSAITRVVEVLNKADILAVVREYRTAQGDQRTVAAARLGHSGAVIMESMDKFSPAENTVSKAMFLESLGTTQYWQEILGSAADPKKSAAELVHLYSRVMFASTHLPNMARLLGTVESSTPKVKARGKGAAQLPVAGESRITVRLTDAGERASDPDRIARSIDGIDMLYSACASIARKPAMDLRLDGIDGRSSRDIHFSGERDSASAVCAVIESIPEALAEYGDDEDLDLDELVASLPIFEDLITLASLGTFTENDLKDITETMHQGVMLVLESGVVLVNESAAHLGSPPAASNAQAESARNGHFNTKDGSEPPILTRRPKALQPSQNRVEQPERDEHYDRYLREREAMQRSSSEAPPANSKGAAVDSVLRNLGKSRDG